MFLSHLHADHIGDIPGLLGSLAKAGRVDPVEIWGGGTRTPSWACRRSSTTCARRWPGTGLGSWAPPDHRLRDGRARDPVRPSETIYERNGVTVSCFPAIHGLSGAVGYSVTYSGLKVVFSGDTRPCRYVADAAVGADLLIHECFQSPAVYAKPPGCRWRQR